MSQHLTNDDSIIDEVKILIDSSRKQLAISVNATMSLLYWKVGTRIRKEILQNQKAEYGKQVVHLLSEQLTLAYGKGWSKRQLHHCLRIAETFPDEQIVHTLCAQLTWSHLRLIIAIDDSLKRDFYIEMCKHEKWSTRALQGRINSMLYERTAISKKPEETIEGDLKLLKKEELLSPDLVFRDPYLLEFLGLSNEYSEKDLESAILAELQHFIIELGSDFAFMARQKRITIDSRDY